MKLNPTWETLKIIGQSKIVSLTAFIPFIGYLLLFNDSIISYTSLSTEFAGAASEVSATIHRLYYLYFGLTFLGFSSIFYILFCPKEIKENLSEHEYSNKEIILMTHARLFPLKEKYESVLKAGSPQHEELVNYFASYSNSYSIVNETSLPKDLAFDHAKKTELNSKLDILRFHWNHLNNEHFSLRLSIMFGYAIGFTLVIIPSVVVFVSVVENIVKKIP